MTFQVWVEMDNDQPTGWLFLCVYKITSIIVNMKTKRAYKYRFYPTPEQGWIQAISVIDYPASPELNLIEILWRKVKYEWLNQ